MRLIVPAIIFVLVGAWLLRHFNGHNAVFSGTIEMDESRVASRTGGRVAELLVEEGEAATNNQVLVRLEADDLAARRAYAAAVLAESEAGPRTQEVAAAYAQWRALEAERDVARLDARRKEDLVKQRTVSEAERDDAVARLSSLEQRAAAAEQQYHELSAGTRPEKLAQARAQLDELESLWKELNVRAPADCWVETLHVKPGDVVNANTPVATLLLQTPPWVRVYVPGPWLGRVQVGAEVRVQADAFPDRMFTGRVMQINRQAEFTPRNVQTVDERVKQVFGVKVLLPVGESLRAGMSVDVRFPN